MAFSQEVEAQLTLQTRGAASLRMRMPTTTILNLRPLQLFLPGTLA